jgi:hypothetical protein
MRPSGLRAMKRTRFKPSAATLIPNALGRFKANVPALRPFVSVMRLGTRARDRLSCFGWEAWLLLMSER